ncbi:hypothetical protein Rcae01_03342 [Novipirellula caenicola]|uniref:Uncharacterized protein n=1 Tax=Novipirellula caenicola TaxID=1536901 RepID=A0ABP9VRU8_9BACT
MNAGTVFGVQVKEPRHASAYRKMTVSPEHFVFLALCVDAPPEFACDIGNPLNFGMRIQLR